MRQTILLGFFALLAVGTAREACAQHHDGAGHGFTRGGHEFNRDHGFNRDRGASPYGYGYAYLPYDSGYAPDDFDNDYSYQPPPPFDSYQPPSQPAQPAAQRSAHPVVKEYTWPAAGEASSSASPAPSESEPQNFAIVLKNGSTLSATMVLASEHGLQYVDPDGRLLRISIGEVDRAATLKLDRARNLNLHLPAAE